MNRDITLKKNLEFKRVYKKGRAYVSRTIVSYVLKKSKSDTRIGITASKKTGNAVKRNRSRRIILAAYRKVSPYIKPGYDIVFVARAATPSSKSSDILKVMKKHLLQAGAIVESEIETVMQI